MDAGLMVLRIALGGALVLQSHGKLSRAARPGTIAFFDDMGFVPARRMVTVAGLSELLAGIALLVGFATVPATAAAIGVLVGAVAVNARNGYANSNGGAEYPLVALGVAMTLALTGAGAISLDALAGWEATAPAVSIAAIAVGGLSAVPLLVARARRLAARRVEHALSSSSSARVSLGDNPDQKAVA